MHGYCTLPSSKRASHKLLAPHHVVVQPVQAVQVHACVQLNHRISAVLGPVHEVYMLRAAVNQHLWLRSQRTAKKAASACHVPVCLQVVIGPGLLSALALMAPVSNCAGQLA